MQLFLLFFRNKQIVTAKELLEATAATYASTVVGTNPPREQNSLLFFADNITLDLLRERLKRLAILELCEVHPEHAQRLSFTRKVARVCGPLQEAGARPMHTTTMLMLLQMQQQHILALERRKGACSTFRDQHRILSLQNRISTQSKMLINDGRRGAALEAPANVKTHIAFLQAENQSLTREVHALKEALDKYRQQVTWSEALLQENARTDELHSTIDELRAEINGKDDENEKLLENIEELEDEVAQSIELLEKVNIKMDDLQAKIDEHDKSLGKHSGTVLRFLQHTVARSQSLRSMRAAAVQAIAFSTALLNRDKKKINATVNRVVHWSEAEYTQKRRRCSQ